MMSMLKAEETLLDRAKVGQAGLMTLSVQAFDYSSKERGSCEG